MFVFIELSETLHVVSLYELCVFSKMWLLSTFTCSFFHEGMQAEVSVDIFPEPFYLKDIFYAWYSILLQYLLSNSLPFF